MTRSFMDGLYYSSIVVLLPLSIFVLFLWSKFIWNKLKKDGRYILDRVFPLMLPGILLMAVVVAPIFFVASLQKADERCVAMFSAEPEYVKAMPQEKQKADRLEDMTRYCPHSDYEDIFSRIRGMQ